MAWDYSTTPPEGGFPVNRDNQAEGEIKRLEAENRKLRAALKEYAPYKEWCADPLACHGKGTCPRDPNCGD